MANGTIMMVGVDEQGRVRAASPDFLDFTGFATDTICGQRLSDVSVSIADDHLRVTRADGSSAEFTTASWDLEGDDNAISNVVVLTPLGASGGLERSLGISLSERESQILGYVADGYRVATIARALFISPSTVRNHLSAVFKKLGVANQAELLERLKG